MRRKSLAACLSTALLVAQLTCAGYGLAENTSALHLYQGIPMEGTTQDAVSRILLEKTGVSFEVSTVVCSGNADGIEDFGYTWNLQLDFQGRYIGVNRILLSSAQPARVQPEDFQTRVQADLCEFIDVESRLTTLYGEPDCRFFLSNLGDMHPKSRYMLEGGTWVAQQMLGLCDQGRTLRARSIWGNVMLEAWVDHYKANVEGRYLSRIMLYYYPDMKTTGAMASEPITVYAPPEGG